MSISELRREYGTAGLSERELAVSPIEQFRQWFQQAREAQIPEPNAMTLATATLEGRPSARTVLLKEFDDHGFVFYTNYHSRKGRELSQNPHACLVFYWIALERQVCISGQVSQVSREESETYFHSRPEGSQLGAWASQQSEIIEGPEILEERLSQLVSKYQGRVIPVPEYWGGYRLAPASVEFWQGRPNRLHDRLRYTLQTDGQWLIQRLSP